MRTKPPYFVKLSLGTTLLGCWKTIGGISLRTGPFLVISLPLGRHTGHSATSEKKASRGASPEIFCSELPWPVKKEAGIKGQDKNLCCSLIHQAARVAFASLAHSYPPCSWAWLNSCPQSSRKESLRFRLWHLKLIHWSGEQESTCKENTFGFWFVCLFFPPRWRPLSCNSKSAGSMGPWHVWGLAVQEECCIYSIPAFSYAGLRWRQELRQLL